MQWGTVGPPRVGDLGTAEMGLDHSRDRSAVDIILLSSSFPDWIWRLAWAQTEWLSATDKWNSMYDIELYLLS